MKFLLILASIGVVALLPLALAQNKVQNRDLFRRNNTNILVLFKDSQDSVYRTLSTRRFANRTAKIQSLKRGLQSLTRRSHAAVIRGLRQLSGGIETKSFWMSNKMLVKGANPRIVSYLNSLPSVRNIMEDPIFRTTPERLRTGVRRRRPSQQPANPEWNIERVGAPEVWETTRGDGIVVAVIDSGVRESHEALRGQWVGKENNGWFDAVNGVEDPVDDQGHGTHCTGIAVGLNGIGMAPEAKFMSCRACVATENGDHTTCTGSDLLECEEWAICPHDGTGNNDNDCAYAPHVVSYSNNGGQNDQFHNEAIRAYDEAGIFHAYSIGNTGPECGTALSPGDQEITFSVGATDRNDKVADLSARGPAVDTGAIVPKIVAPGIGIRSSLASSDTAYEEWQGTSMSTPHVSGAAALILSQNRDLSPERVRQYLTDNAFRDLPRTGQSCGGIPEDEYPNNIAGFGRLDVAAAFRASTS